MDGVKTFVGALALFGGFAIALSVYPGNALIAGILGAAGMSTLLLLSSSKLPKATEQDPRVARVFLIIGISLILGVAYCVFKLMTEEVPTAISLLGHATGALAAGSLPVFFLARKFSI